MLLTSIRANSGSGAWCVASKVPAPRLAATSSEPASASASHSAAAGSSAKHNTIDSTKAITDREAMDFVCDDSS